MQFVELNHEFGLISKAISVRLVMQNLVSNYFQGGLKGR